MEETLMQNQEKNAQNENVTYLSDKAWDKLMEVCKNPPKPTEAMKELMSRPRLKEGQPL